ncbi:unnamed protein product, partial [Rotaria sp. Silwood2]
ESTIENLKQREAFRMTCGQKPYLLVQNIRLAFALGKTFILYFDQN